jgi:hypothetical protein
VQFINLVHYGAWKTNIINSLEYLFHLTYSIGSLFQCMNTLRGLIYIIPLLKKSCHLALIWGWNFYFMLFIHPKIKDMRYDRNNHVKALMKVLSLNWVETTFRSSILILKKIKNSNFDLFKIWYFQQHFLKLFCELFKSYEFLESKSLNNFLNHAFVCFIWIHFDKETAWQSWISYKFPIEHLKFKICPFLL